MKRKFFVPRTEKPIRLHRRLGLTLMLNFLFFGLFLGTVIYLLAVVFDTGVLVRDVGTMLSRKLPGNGLHATNSREIHRQDKEKLFADLQEKYSSLQGVVSMKLYRMTNGGGWMETRRLSNRQISNIPVTPGVLSTLEKAMKEDITTSNSVLFFELYLHDKDERSVPEKTMVYLRVDKRVFWNRIVADRELLLGYAVILFVLSAVMGFLFSRKITVPVNQLIEAARQISEGNYSYRNKLKNWNEIGYLGKVLNQTAERVENHIREIEYRSETMEAMNRIDKTVLSLLFDPHVVDIVAEIVATFVKTGIVVLAVPDSEARVVKISSYQMDRTDGIVLFPGPIPMDSLTEDNDFRTRPFMEIRAYPGTPLPEWCGIITALDTGTVIHAPLTSAKDYQGSCFVIDPRSGFTEGEKEAIRMLADQVGVALQNARIYREKEDLLIELLMALSNAIDAKSRWTAGHSERVAGFAVKLGRLAGLSEDELETLRFSAILHDIGKIATPESILDKPGRLTDEEYAEIKKHPEEGARIVGGIKSVRDIVPGILHHHEHWNGGGYPQGLSGERIPLLARILNIADVYDAVSADRPYRKGMSPAEVKDFMNSMSGKMFDPELLRAFMEMEGVI